MKLFTLARFTILLAALLAGLLTTSTQAQTPAWQSAAAFGTGGARTTNTYQVVATTGDGSGNLYVIGVFQGTVSFGSTALTSVNSNQGDAFVAKWSGTTNAFVYAQRIGQASATSATGDASSIVALAVSGHNVYVVGSFGGTIIFGAATGGVTLTAGSNGYGTYVARLTDTNTAGSFAWARAVNNTTSNTSSSIDALAVSGTNVYVGGRFSGSAGFGSTTLTSVGAITSRDAFVAKLTDTGATTAFGWAVRGGGSDNEYVIAMAASGSSVYVAGTFGSTSAAFGSTTLTNASSTEADVFIAQVADAGTTASFTAAQRAGGVGPDQVFTNALAVSPAGVYLVGSYDNTPLTFGSIAITAASNSILARWNPATGAFAWVQAAPGGSSPPNLTYRSLGVNGTNLYMAGSFSGTVSLGGTPLSSTDQDVWVGKFADTGTGLTTTWAKQAGGSFPDAIYTLSLSGTTIYVQGATGSATLSFAPVTLTNPYYNGQYGSGGFLASLTDPTLLATAAPTAIPSLTLYPNPAHGTATVQLPAGAESVQLLDGLGREVRRYAVRASTPAVLDLQGLPAGLYVLRSAGAAQRLVVE